MTRRAGDELAAHLLAPGWIIERAAGQSYGSFLHREVLGPLGLTETFSGSPGTRPGLAAGRYDGAAVPSVELDTVSLGTGSIWSTASDLDPFTHDLIRVAFPEDA